MTPTTTPICGVKLRNSGVCGSAATWVVITPWNQRRLVCDDCARHYAAVSGFIARPIDQVCDSCNQPLPKNYGFYCWCGGVVGVKRYNVDGLWFTLCETHQPLQLSILWRRLWLRLLYRIKSAWIKPKEMTAAEVADLTEMARQRAKRDR
jgi:hypothetical protein